MQEVWAEPERGPPPYLQTLPHTKLSSLVRPSSLKDLLTKGVMPADMADLWDVNLRMAKQMREQHAVAIQGLGVSPPNSTPDASGTPSRLQDELAQLNRQRAQEPSDSPQQGRPTKSPAQQTKRASSLPSCAECKKLISERDPLEGLNSDKYCTCQGV